METTDFKLDLEETPYAPQCSPISTPSPDTSPVRKERRKRKKPKSLILHVNDKIPSPRSPSPQTPTPQIHPPLIPTKTPSPRPPLPTKSEDLEEIITQIKHLRGLEAGMKPAKRRRVRKKKSPEQLQAKEKESDLNGFWKVMQNWKDYFPNVDMNFIIKNKPCPTSVSPTKVQIFPQQTVAPNQLQNASIPVEKKQDGNQLSGQTLGQLNWDGNIAPVDPVMTALNQSHISLPQNESMHSFENAETLPLPTVVAPIPDLDLDMLGNSDVFPVLDLSMFPDLIGGNGMDVLPPEISGELG